MKGRLNSTVWLLMAINAVLLVAVLGLAYGAGARSGGLSLIDFGALPMIAGFEFLGAVFLVLAGSIFLFLMLASRVLKPMSQMVEFSEKLAGGEYETRAEVRPDDFGAAAENFNRAAELLEKTAAVQAADEALRRELEEFEKTISQAARGDLRARLRTSEPALAATAEAFNGMVEGLSRSIDRVRATAGDVTASVNQVIAAAEQMANGAGQQEQNTAAATGAVEALSGKSKQVSGQADSAVDAARQARELAEQGNNAVRDTATGMQRIRASMQATASKIKTLGDRSLEIYEIINIIHETNLLALNAVVEASRGGQGGQALEVLSAELRKLAEHSRGATRDIVALLKAIHSESNEAVVVMDEGNRVAEAGARLSEQAAKAFAGMAAALAQSSELSQSVSAASRQQVQGAEVLLSSMQSIGALMRQNAARGGQMVRAVEQMLRAAEQLNQAVIQLRTTSAPAIVKPEKEVAAAVARA